MDEAFRTGDLSGQGGATLPVKGRFDVSELFAEARLPLIEGKTGAQTLSIEAGYRFSDYSTGFTTDTYKAGMDWAPVDSLRFRASFQRAVRAPNVGELFSSQSVALDGTEDPCAGILGDARPRTMIRPRRDRVRAHGHDGGTVRQRADESGRPVQRPAGW